MSPLLIWPWKRPHKPDASEEDPKELILSDVTIMGLGYCVIGLEQVSSGSFRSVRPMPPALTAMHGLSRSRAASPFFPALRPCPEPAHPTQKTINPGT